MDLLVSGYRDVTLYLRRGACLTLVATIDPQGTVAFVSVAKEGSGMRDLSIDTWLFHGDRKRSHWRWVGGRYESVGREETILGPHR